ncbi:hypothetical protein [Photobacterium sp. J15]|uniref:hypothetical protein n=1 Tax=Photobacterium sp. J15 TaxID=265901 RepID=UPI0007E3AD6C|nr:hypothetical protein [Photobacterium sp. J15]
MPLAIDLHHLQIGKFSDPDLLLELNSEARVEPDLYCFDDGNVLRSMSIIPIKEQTLKQRLVDILEETIKKFELENNNSPICVLLPQMDEVDDFLKQSLSYHFDRLIHVLERNEGCYFFPYGRSALLFAWDKVEKLIFKQNYQEVLLLAIDTDFRLFSQLTNGLLCDVENIASECVILASIKRAESGLKRDWFSYELRTSDQSESAALAFVFNKYVQTKGLPIYQFYAPFDGSGTLVDEWTNAYHRLSPCAGKQTQVVMTTPFTGDLGACSGLYNLLHLNDRYQQGKYLYNTMQLEISPRLYRAAALYSWQDE